MSGDKTVDLFQTGAPFITTHLDTLRGAPCRVIAKTPTYAWIQHGWSELPVTRRLTDLISIPKYRFQVTFQWEDKTYTYDTRAENASQARQLAEHRFVEKIQPTGNFPPLEDRTLVVVQVVV